MQSRRSVPAALAYALLLALLVPSLAAQAPAGGAEVSEKQDLAVFALGWYGWSMPPEALGTIDLELRKVFVDLGRFNVIGIEERLSSGGLTEFIDAMRKAKATDVVIPDKYQFGEALLTEAEWNRLVGSFIVAVPVVTAYLTQWNQQTIQWETDLRVGVTFIDVASGGSVIGVAEVSTKGTGKRLQSEAVFEAITAVPTFLQYEIRKVPAFQLTSRVIAIDGSAIKMALGRNMGVTVGDEYSVVSGGMVAGLSDEREVGLLVVREVGAEVSTGRAVYGGREVKVGASLREIPRLGVDLEPYLHVVGLPGSWAFLPGARLVASRHFADIRPFVSAQVPVGQVLGVFTALFVPVNATAGLEYDLPLGRLSLTPRASVGASYVHFFEALSQTSTDTDYFSHVGAQAWARASYLVTRDLRIAVEVGLEYWLRVSPFFRSYGGFGFGVGADLKL